jgi:hypothetical protein
MKTTTFNRSLVIAMLIGFAAFSTSCKKTTVSPNQDARFNGIWSHTRIVSSFLSILTQSEFKPDGTGVESVFRITTSGGDTPEVSAFTWSTQNNSTLILSYEDGSNDTLSYVFDEFSFTLTDRFGNDREFFETE